MDNPHIHLSASEPGLVKGVSAGEGARGLLLLLLAVFGFRVFRFPCVQGRGPQGGAALAGWQGLGPDPRVLPPQAREGLASGFEHHEGQAVLHGSSWWWPLVTLALPHGVSSNSLEVTASLSFPIVVVWARLAIKTNDRWMLSLTSLQR